MLTRSDERWKLMLNMVSISTMEKFWQQQSMVLARESYRKISTQAKVTSALKLKIPLCEHVREGRWKNTQSGHSGGDL